MTHDSLAAMWAVATALVVVVTSFVLPEYKPMFRTAVVVLTILALSSWLVGRFVK